MTLHIECHYHSNFDLFEVKISNLLDYETVWHDWGTLEDLISTFRGDRDVIYVNTVTITTDKLSRLRAAEYLEAKLEDARFKQRK